METTEPETGRQAYQWTRRASGMERRRFLAGAVLVTTAGCLGADDSYPGGTLVVENRATERLSVTVTAMERSPRFSRTVGERETSVERSFVDADRGEAVRLDARIGDTADPALATFEFLPAGGDTAPPEVARLVVRGPVEAEAEWSATAASE